jgi:serine protease AprX
MLARAAAPGVVAPHHAHRHEPNRFAVVPTPQRLRAEDRYTGRGVTIAFLDSGFSRHPDLTEPVDRIVAMEDRSPASSGTGGAEPWRWHGTQTSVVAAGNGWLSSGFYRGLAPDARLALVAIGDRGRIRDRDIVDGIEWVIANRERLGIRVLNLSLGGDEDLPYVSSEVDRAAEAAVAAGIVVVAAAGNAGCTDRHRSIPPANSPSVITVGGADDGNRLDGEPGLYCSNYGATIDGLLKPEIIAPAMWVAAPLLEGSAEHDLAVALGDLDRTPDALLGTLPWTVWRAAGLPARLRLEPNELRAEVLRLQHELRLVAAHYQHVDGTSFAAPVVSALVAQMLEANPALTPAAVRDILVSTAIRLPHAPSARQGYGMVNPRRAVELALTERAMQHRCTLGAPYGEHGALVFSCHDDEASTVALVGDFNGWNPARHPLVRDDDGIWRARVTGLPAGLYAYKYVVDGQRWLDDRANLRRVDDGYGGFNSIVSVG